MDTRKKIRIEEIGAIELMYAYLEVFYLDSTNPFLDIMITEEKELVFTFYPYPEKIHLSISEMEYIINTAKEFLPEAIENEESFHKWYIEEHGEPFKEKYEEQQEKPFKEKNEKQNDD